MADELPRARPEGGVASARSARRAGCPPRRSAAPRRVSADAGRTVWCSDHCARLGFRFLGSHSRMGRIPGGARHRRLFSRKSPHIHVYEEIECEAPSTASSAEIFADLFDNDSMRPYSDTTADQMEWDSLHHITLIVAIEGRFGIKFKTAELEGLRNVGHLVELIERKREEARLASGRIQTEELRLLFSSTEFIFVFCRWPWRGFSYSAEPAGNLSSPGWRSCRCASMPTGM